MASSVVTTSSSGVSCKGKGKGKQRIKAWLRKWLPVILVYVPYFVALTWTSLHPVISVITGEMKCRGSYIDENALEVGYFGHNQHHAHSNHQIYNTNTKLRTKNLETRRGGLCEALTHIGSSIPCRNQPFPKSHSMSLDVAKIVPPAAPVRPTEAILLVVRNPACPVGMDDDDGSSDMSSSPWWTNSKTQSSSFHSNMLQLMTRLQDPSECPWLAKTIYVISPITSACGDDSSISSSGVVANHSNDGTDWLADSVELFFQMSSSGNTNHHPNRLSLSSWVGSDRIRQVLVLDIHNNDSGASASDNDKQEELRLLVQGRRGALPNLDLVFVTLSALAKFAFLQDNHGDVTVSLHSYSSRVKQWGAFLDQYIMTSLLRIGSTTTRAWKQYLMEGANMVAFATQMALGPLPPHSAALDRGIDSLTLSGQMPHVGHPRGGQRQRHVQGQEDDENGRLLCLALEQLIRAFGNLHERLHHSITQYLLPSPSKFVSHSEYLIPSILLLIPLMVRILHLLLWDIRVFCFRQTIQLATACTLLVIVWLLFQNIIVGDNNDGKSSTSLVVLLNAGYSVIYGITLLWLYRCRGSNMNDSRKEEGEDNKEEKVEQIQKSIQCLACLLALYLHVPIMMAHVSLFYPSAAFWTPLLAFPNHHRSPKRRQQQRQQRGWITPVTSLLFLFATWPPIYLVPKIFSTYTLYISIVYTPLHLILTSLWLL
eukprot:scaffold418589_cov61-Attheya_sp.AAC.1